ncbi:hypothetical protein ACQJBY_042531 [Aegilops geniculata]
MGAHSPMDAHSKEEASSLLGGRPPSTSSSRLHGGRKCGAHPDDALDFVIKPAPSRMVAWSSPRRRPSPTSSTRCRGGSWSGAPRRGSRRDSAVCREGCRRRAAVDRTEFAKTMPVSTSSSRRHVGRRHGGSGGCRCRAAVDGATEFAKMTPMSTSSTRCRKDHDGELARRTPAIHFVMLELEDGGVAPVGDVANVYFIKLEPGGVELAGIPPCAAEEGETELARRRPTSSSSSWCHGGRRRRRSLLGRRPSSSSSSRRHGGQRRGGSQRCCHCAALDSGAELAKTTPIANIVNPVPRRIVAWSSQGGHHQHQHHQAGPEVWSS